jgi:hypothetical protein
MFGFDLGSIAKGVMEGFIGPLFGYLNKKQDTILEKYKVDGQVNHDLVNADIALNQARVAVLTQEFQYKVVRIAWCLFVFPVGTWWALYFFDSSFREIIPNWTWRVLTPEAYILNWAGWIIGSLFLHSAVTSFWRK